MEITNEKLSVKLQRTLSMIEDVEDVVVWVMTELMHMRDGLTQNGSHLRGFISGWYSGLNDVTVYLYRARKELDEVASDMECEGL